MEYICKYCGKKCKNLNSLTQHEIRCHSNPNRLTNCGNHGATKGYPGHNQYTKAKMLGLPKPKISEETRKKLSIVSKRTQQNRIITPEEREKLSLGGRHSVEVQGDLRRSKNEIKFCKLCEEYFNNVKHNETIFNGWDADVIIEDIKFAVLWNGPWHYKVITSEKYLKTVQRRDSIKIKMIKENGYVPFIIKDEDKSRSKNDNYVKKKFEEFVSYLKENSIIK